ncbi:MAG: zf-HC2 domain-containing protein [Candidatus Brocadiaceae bacterium]|nr:zf-HC2 domain-containing protein [Candidatus Brocadiaceae bacterium]
MRTKPDCKCSKRKLIFAYLDDTLDHEKKKGLEEHLKECEDCRRVYDKSKELLELLEETEFNPYIINRECLDIEDLASYAFNDIKEAEKANVEKHIFSCDHCLYEIINLWASEESIPDELVYTPLLNTNLQEVIPETVPFKPKSSKDSLVEKIIERISAWIDLIKGIQAPPLQHAWLTEEAETTTEPSPLEIKKKLISLSIKPDTKGSYSILPYPDEILLCNDAGDYKNLWKFVGNTENYWGGCILTDDYTPETFPAQQIKQRIFYKVTSDNYKKAIIGISSKKEEIEEFVCRLQEYSTLPEKSFEKLLNIVVLIISLETGSKNA